VTAVGALLAKLGLTPQKPLQRAYQRDPATIEKWQREQFPAIARQAKAAGGEVNFWDESGFRADAVHGKTWGAQTCSVGPLSGCAADTAHCAGFAGDLRSGRPRLCAMAAMQMAGTEKRCSTEQRNDVTIGVAVTCSRRTGPL